jgi:hypothetical protein
MASKTPDFKNMTPEQMRENISALNREIRELRKLSGQAMGGFFKGQAVTLGLGVPATLVFPPLGAGIMAAGMVHGSQKTVESMVIRDRLAEAETLRHKFKTVWRARPGRKFLDIDARCKRENERKLAKQRQKMIDDAKRKYGRFGFGID